MQVRYTPPLMEQIRGRHAMRPGARAPVIVKTPNGWVPRVDPKTRQAMPEPQQFRMNAERVLTPLPRSQWVDAPDVIEVESLSYR
jgi:hypothetical protein